MVPEAATSNNGLNESLFISNQDNEVAITVVQKSRLFSLF